MSEIQEKLLKKNFCFSFWLTKLYGEVNIIVINIYVIVINVLDKRRYLSVCDDCLLLVILASLRNTRIALVFPI